MKILIALAILTFYSSNAQFSVAKLDGTPILDGTSLHLETANPPGFSLDFHVVNNTSTPLFNKNSILLPTIMVQNFNCVI
jgi:hypothetical protein